MSYARFCLRIPKFLPVALAVASYFTNAAWGENTARAPIRDPERIFRKYLYSYKELQQRQIVMQKYDYSCGAATLATIVRYYWGDNVDEAYFLDLLPKLKLSKEQLKDRIENGLTLTDLKDLAQEGGYDAAMGKVTFGELAEGKVPVIVGLIVRKHEHFAVFRGTDGMYAYLADPIRGNVRTPICEFQEQWQKNGILLVAKRGHGAKDVNPMALRASEIERGMMNDQYVHRNGIIPPPPPAVIRAF
jgi:uncharacterized protein